jgi:hypothetical protein
MDLASLASYGWLGTAMLGVATFVWKVRTDAREAALKRFDKFQEMEKISDTVGFKRVVALIYGDEAKPGEQLCDITDKEDFMDFYEQIALLVNSGLMMKQVALYMHGAVAIQAYDSEDFWKDTDDHRTDPYWSLFRDFCVQMKKLRQKYPDDKMPVRHFRL